MADDHHGRKTNPDRALVALAFFIVLALILWFVASRLLRYSRMQDCILSGRTNCAPAEEQQPR
ncbi:MAG TPA: hypothetical protein VE620_07730 [Myxococcales bacterium]|nr:hypothetical protein [Myxococcales bacterium]